jgi:mannose-6-phosphate isomerase-like protein (cupin superfamily)
MSGASDQVSAQVFRPDPDDEYSTDERCFILELSNSEADEGLSVARARVEPGVTTAWHRVAATTERYVVLEGKGLVEVEGLGAEHVQTQDVVVIPPGARQRITNTGAGDLLFLALCTPRFRHSRYVHDE